MLTDQQQAAEGSATAAVLTAAALQDYLSGQGAWAAGSAVGAAAVPAADERLCRAVAELAASSQVQQASIDGQLPQLQELPLRMAVVSCMSAGRNECAWPFAPHTRFSTATPALVGLNVLPLLDCCRWEAHAPAKPRSHRR